MINILNNDRIKKIIIYYIGLSLISICLIIGFFLFIPNTNNLIVKSISIVLLIIGASWILIADSLIGYIQTKWTNDEKNITILIGILIFIYGGIVSLLSLVL